MALQRQTVRIRFSCIVAVLVTMRPFAVSSQPHTQQPSELIGVWQGTSTCTDRIAAPACQDETVVYELTAGTKPDTVHWKANKIVNGDGSR
jgi:hypothetical protein